MNEYGRSRRGFARPPHKACEKRGLGSLFSGQYAVGCQALEFWITRRSQIAVHDS